MNDHAAGTGASGPYREHWTRDGFTGDAINVFRPAYVPDFLSVAGPHAPKRLNIANVAMPAADPLLDMPVVVATAKSGLRLAVARRSRPMSYILRNVECDEIHFVQAGSLTFVTAVGTLTAQPGDFVCIPRSISYRISETTPSALTVVVEVPPAVRFSDASGPDLFDRTRSVHYAALVPSPAAAGEALLILKAEDELSHFRLPHDPLTASDQVEGTIPVWKANLADIKPIANHAPVPFLETAGNEVLFYTLSARPARRRPPIHINADYDELIHFFAGPGAWGAVSEPGTMTLVPKGVTHNGPSEDVPEGYLAWMLETRTTLRLTPDALAVADLMETDSYGRHPTSLPHSSDPARA